MGKNTGPTPAVVQQVWERDRGACARCGKPLNYETRGFTWSVHHRSPRGAGGRREAWVNQPANLVVLCGSATTPGSCHRWVENNRAEAIDTGWLVSRIGQAISEDIAILHYHHGYGHLTDDPDDPFRKETA